MATLADLPTPAFVVNRHAFAANCQQVLETARDRGLKLRPHIKTHKTLEGIELQVCGTTGDDTIGHDLLTGFVASTIPEVKLLVNYLTSSSSHHHHHHPAKNSTRLASSSSSDKSILYGVPISAAKLPAIKALQLRLNIYHAKKVTGSAASSPATKKQKQGPLPSTVEAPPQICLLMDHVQQVDMVDQFLTDSQSMTTDHDVSKFSVFIKLDTGYHRAGTTLDKQGIELVDKVLASPSLDLMGFYTLCGHAYDVNDQSVLDDIAQTDIDSIQTFLQLLEEHLSSSSEMNTSNTHGKSPKDVLPDLTISIGSTPSLFHHWNPTTKRSISAMEDDDEQSPSQVWWSKFLETYPTVALEIHPGNYTFYDRQQLYTQACQTEDSIAGRVLTRVIGHYNDEHRPHTIMMDAGATALTKETTPQGGMAAIAGDVGRDVDVYKMSQEVSMARRRQHNDNTLLDDLPLGSLATLYPNHSCLAAACFDKYYIIDDPTCRFLPDTPIVDEWEPVKGW